MKPTYTTEEAAAALGYNIITIRDFILEGRLEATKDEKGRWQIPAREITRIRNWNRKNNPNKKEKRKP